MVEQKTNEWYEIRHNMITASNIWKIFKSEAQRNSIIYEKCNPCSIPYNSVYLGYGGSSLQWGQKYEPLSALLYEIKNKTTLGEFGCISHPKYPFLGASPDGIVVDPESVYYGSMIEIKNIVNREITDTPKNEYWIQMQIQMEVCDLDHCHFVETRFKEFYSLEEWKTCQYKIKGILNCSNPARDKSMFYILPEESENPEDWLKQFSSLNNYIFWGLDQYSCIHVERNRQWFQDSIPIICETWETIVKERETGYQHRKPKTKTKQIHQTNVIVVNKI
jgi:putative phage-type endonuclease